MRKGIIFKNWTWRADLKSLLESFKELSVKIPGIWRTNTEYSIKTKEVWPENKHEEKWEMYRNKKWISIINCPKKSDQFKVLTS